MARTPRSGRRTARRSRQHDRRQRRYDLEGPRPAHPRACPTPPPSSRSATSRAANWESATNSNAAREHTAARSRGAARRGLSNLKEPGSGRFIDMRPADPHDPPRPGVVPAASPTAWQPGAAMCSARARGDALAAVHGDPPWRRRSRRTSCWRRSWARGSAAEGPAAARSCLRRGRRRASVVEAPRTRARGGGAGVGRGGRAARGGGATRCCVWRGPTPRARARPCCQCRSPPRVTDPVARRVALGDAAGEVEMWLWWRHGPQLRGPRRSRKRRTRPRRPRGPRGDQAPDDQRGRHARNSPPKPGAAPRPACCGATRRGSFAR